MGEFTTLLKTTLQQNEDFLLSDIQLLKKGSVELVENSYNKSETKVYYMLMLNMNKNGSFRSHQLANAMIFAYCGILLRISYYFATQVYTDFKMFSEKC